jgi:hypothetical protein
VPVRPYSQIRIAFMCAGNPLSVFKGWCTLRSTHR